MSNLSSVGAIKDILERYGFSFSKSLGQNFLINPGICPKMAEASGADGETGVIEVGPGIGVLTYELARRAKKVVAVELDQRLLPVLGETLEEFDNVKVVGGDIMKLDLHSLIQEEFQGMDVVVCANLPYYITSPVIMRLLEERLPIRSLTVMVQKEAAQRLCAELGKRDVGAITVAVRYFSTPRLLFQVSRGSFMPAPNVDSAVIRLDIHKAPPIQVADEAFFFRVTRGAFAQRRKTVANSLSASLGLPKAQVEAALTAAGAPVNIRAEKLTLEQFGAIATSLGEMA